MALRFSNGIFEPIWKRDNIDHVQITAAETVGVEQRGKFYEGTGALRDMVPNHMFQLLSMVAMEAPTSFDADAVRTREGQGDRGDPSAGPASGRARRGARAIPRRAGWRHDVRGYREEPDVDRNSSTETYVAMKLGDRQLALGRGAVLHTHRQAPVARADRDRDPFQAGPVRAVPRHAGGQADAEHHVPAHPAARGRHAAVQRQGAGAARASSAASTWTSATPTISTRSQHGLRDAAVRRA